MIVNGHAVGTPSSTAAVSVNASELKTSICGAQPGAPSAYMRRKPMSKIHLLEKSEWLQPNRCHGTSCKFRCR